MDGTRLSFYTLSVMQKAITAHYDEKSSNTQMPPMIALTGGIAAGKTTVARQFEALGAGVIDADQIARDLVRPGTDALHHIASHFGPQVLTPEGTLDRKRLRTVIFQDPNARLWLEQLLHPRIRAQMILAAQSLNTPYGIWVIPLLKKRTDYPKIQRVLVVDISISLQLKRLQARDHMTEKAAQAILDAQLSRTERLALADDVILNDGHWDHLHEAVHKLHQMYRELTHQK